VKLGSQIKMDKEQRPKIKSAYLELKQVLSDFKDGKISQKDIMDKIQLKENLVRPYGKVTEEGKISLNEIIDEPLTMEIEEWKKLTRVMKEEKWDRFTQTIKNGYIDKYIHFNEYRANQKKYQKKNQIKKEDYDNQSKNSENSENSKINKIN
jgi:hypothetical protein